MLVRSLSRSRYRPARARRRSDARPTRAIARQTLKNSCSPARFPSLFFSQQVLPQDVDLLHPPAALEARKHKLKRLVQSPNSFFMDVKCQVRLSQNPKNFFSGSTVA